MTVLDGTGVVERLWPGVIIDLDDDLSGVLRNVRVNRLPNTRRTWANSWQTRAFLHLALRTVYERSHLGNSDEPGPGPQLWGSLKPEGLAERAQELLPGSPAADALTVDRWKETWGHRGAFVDDLVAYLFRPGPYLRRLESLRDVIRPTPGLPLTDFLRGMCRSEYASASANPLYALQLWLQAAMPVHEMVFRHIRLLESTSLPLRAELYRLSFTPYGLAPPEHVTWADFADMSATLMRGMLLRGRALGHEPMMSDGDTALTGGVIALVSGWFHLERADMDVRVPAAGPAGTPDEEDAA